MRTVTRRRGQLAEGKRQTRGRPRATDVLFRCLPGDSLMHRMWAGTKLICLAVLTLVVAIDPSWAVIGAVAVLVLIAAGLAKIPRGVIPRPPWWLLVSLAIGLGLSLIGGGLPAFARVLALSLLFMAASLLLTWTTAPAELGPAIGQLGAPLRRLRLPVDDYARTVALCVRCLPLLTSEVGVLLAARRLRRARRLSLQSGIRELPDLLTALLTSTIRRADELGDAIAARGGIPHGHAASTRPGRADAVAVLVVLAASVVPAFLTG